MEDNIRDPEIKEWVQNYEYQIDVDSCVKMAEDISISTANTLVASIVRKIGIIEGVKKANEILKNELNLDTEIEMDSLINEINSLNEMELKLLALQTCNISSQTKQQILEKYIGEFDSSLRKKSNSVIELLRKEVNKIYENLGELPSKDINEVKLVKDKKQRNVTRPFGKKSK